MKEWIVHLRKLACGGRLPPETSPTHEDSGDGHHPSHELAYCTAFLLLEVALSNMYFSWPYCVIISWRCTSPISLTDLESKVVNV